MLGVTISTKRPTPLMARQAHCKEDLEIMDSNPDIKVSLETATSGTESEKYYSGDSEPDFDERFSSSSFSQPGYSKDLLQQEIEYSSTSAPTLITRPSKSGKSVAFNSNSTSIISRNRKSSPKLNSNGIGLNALAPPCTSSGDLIIHSTMERMNRDIDHILARLRILETAYAASVTNNSEGGVIVEDGGRRRRRRLIGGLSYPTVAFIILWPFAVHFLIKLVSWWWTRRRRILAMAMATRRARGGLR